MEPEVQEADALRYTTMESGEQCVMIHGTLTTVMLFVVCWDTPMLLKLVKVPNTVKEQEKYGLMMYNAKETKTVYLCAHIDHGDLIIVAILKTQG